MSVVDDDLWGGAGVPVEALVAIVVSRHDAECHEREVVNLEHDNV